MEPTISNGPSKTFLKRGGIVVGILAIVLISQTAFVKNLFHRNTTTNPSGPLLKDKTLGEAVGQDSNQNGIADWEERLWGLDPTVAFTGGISNKQIIEDKRRALGGKDTGPLNETDRLSRELFTISTTLGQSGDVDDASIREVASNVAEAVNIEKVPNTYSLENIRTVKTTTASLRTYALGMDTIMSKYNSNTPDIELIIKALETGDTSHLSDLNQSIEIYTKVSKDMLAISVPIGVAGYHLDMMNGFAGVATAFSYIKEMNDNAVKSIAGITIYKTYSKKIFQATANMEDYLARYGIL